MRTVDDTANICTDAQSNNKQGAGRRKAITQENKSDITGSLALVFQIP